jgi:hypothetical protein
LVDEEKERGLHYAVFDGAGLSSGVYLYYIRAGSFSDSRFMVLVK